MINNPLYDFIYSVTKIDYNQYYIILLHYLIETNIIANIKYFPNRGTTKDVGGIISTTKRKNTWRLIRIEIDKVTWNKLYAI